MSEALKTGGPAFPFYRPEMRAAGGKVIRLCDEQDGMTLRDYFAAQALAGGIVEFYRAGDAWSGYDDFAESCWRLADAMLKARDQR